MYVRVYYNSDNTVKAVQWPNKTKFNVNDADAVASMKHDQAYAHLDSKIVDSAPFFSEHEYTEQNYFDGDLIKIDHEKLIGLMPAHIIAKKHMTKLDQAIEAELLKETPDPVVIARLQMQQKKCHCYTKKDWYEQALKNIDERVANGEPDKPQIRKKIKDKIKELKKN